MTEGTLEHLIEIDYILDQFSKVKVKKMKPVIRNILRSGVYQLKYMDSVPDHAVCSEAVETGSKKRLFRIKSYFFAGCRYHLLLFSIGESLKSQAIPVE